MSLWIEVLTPHHRVLSRTRFESSRVNIGRGYGNHVYVDDAAVLPEHLIIVREGHERPKARAIEGAAFRLEGGTAAVTCAELGPTAVLQLGSVRLRVRTESDVSDAPSARCLTGLTRQRLSHHLICALPLTLGLIMTALQTWAASWSGHSYWRHLADGMTLLFGAVPWVAAWSLVSYVIARDACVMRHLRIAGLGLLGLLCVSEGLPLAASASGLDPSPDIYMPLKVLVWGATAFAHLGVVRAGRVLTPAVTAALLALAAATGAAWYHEKEKVELTARPAISGLVPSFLRLVPVQARDRLQGDLEGMEVEVAEARDEPLPDGLRR